MMLRRRRDSVTVAELRAATAADSLSFFRADATVAHSLLESSTLWTDIDIAGGHSLIRSITHRPALDRSRGASLGRKPRQSTLADSLCASLCSHCNRTAHSHTATCCISFGRTSPRLRTRPTSTRSVPHCLCRSNRSIPPLASSSARSILHSVAMMLSQLLSKDKEAVLYNVENLTPQTLWFAVYRKKVVVR